MTLPFRGIELGPLAPPETPEPLASESAKVQLKRRPRYSDVVIDMRLTWGSHAYIIQKFAPFCFVLRTEAEAVQAVLQFFRLICLRGPVEWFIRNSNEPLDTETVLRRVTPPDAAVSDA